MNLVKLFKNAAAALVLSFAAAQANAAPVTFDLHWVETMDAGKTASAQLTLDDAILANPGSNSKFFGPDPFLAFALSFGGTSASVSVSFTLADFGDMVLALFSTVDLGTELVGQLGLGDFNIFEIGGAPGTGAAPDGIAPNTFEFNGEIFELVSFAPSSGSGTVSVASSLPLLMLGLMAGLVARRKMKC